jgi:hypothetical protein
MSQLTESGRKSARDQQRNYLTTTLRRHEWFQNVPTQVLAGFAELLLISRQLRAKIKTDGVMRADGTLHPAVEQFRKYKATELAYIQAIDEMRRAKQQTGEIDLVAQMAAIQPDMVEAAEPTE